MKKMLAALLMAAMLLSGVGGALAVSPYLEAGSAAELAMLLAPQANTLSRSDAAGETVYLHVLAGALPDRCGASRVIHYAAYDEFILLFSEADLAQTAYDTLRAQGLRCWIDAALAQIADDPEDTTEPEDTTDPEDTTEPEDTTDLEDTTEPEDATDPEDTTAPEDTTDAEPQTGYTARSWGAAAMGLDLFRNSNAVQKHTAGRAVTVAVIDTGADLTVEVLKSRKISSDSFDFVNMTSKITDVTRGGNAGHGTRVATLLDDLLPDAAELMLLRVFAEDGATQTDVRLALQYALEKGANVINMSMGWENGRSYSFLDDVLQKAYTMGVPVVCAAGNSSADAASEYPANHPTTLAVSAINRSLIYDLRSNYGSAIDFAAPGAELSILGPGNELVTSRGTSFAAPHITAAVADVLLCEPDATVQRVSYALRTSATDLGDTGKDRLYGWGLPQLAAYVSTAVSHLWDIGVTTKLATKNEDGMRVYTCSVCGETQPETIPATKGSVDNAFTDVSRSSFYAAPVTWAAANYITLGTSENRFSPDNSCSRAEMVTFLWRTAGSPIPTQKRSPFVDVFQQSSFYFQPVLWAVEQGVTTGTTETTFAPNETVTRAQTVVFLWRMAGKPQATISNAFSDVDKNTFYYDAVLWALEQGITTGTTATTFEPDAPCTRSQIVTFLYRDFGLPQEGSHGQSAA